MEPRRGFGLARLALIGLPLLLLALMPLAPAALRARSALSESQKAAAEERWQDAGAALRSLYDLEPWRKDLLEPMARYDAQAGLNAQARQEYATALQAGALSVDGRLAYAGLLLLAGERETALQLLADTASMSGLDSGQYQQILTYQYKYNDSAGAALTSAAWADALPADGWAQYALGIAQVIDTPAQAALHLQDAGRLEPALHQRAARIIQAVESQRGAADAAYGWVLLGQGLADAQEWRAAAAAFTNAAQANPQYAEAWALQAEALQQLGRDGKTALDQALALNPDSNLVRVLAASYWRRQGQPETALMLLEQAAAQQPDDPTWQYELGATLAEMGDVAGGLRYYQQAVQIQPDSAETWQRLAEYCIQYGIDVQTTGLNAARQALSLAPADAGILDMVGWMLLANGDPYTAERFLQQALEKDEWNSAVHLHLAQAYLQTDRHKQAQDHLRRVLALDSGGSNRLQAERLLERYFGGY